MVKFQILNSKSQRMSQLTIKSFLQPDQHILSTRENLRRIKKKKREREKQKIEAERAEAARKKAGNGVNERNKPSEQEISITEKRSGVGLLLKDGNVKLKDSINKNDKAGRETNQ